MTKNRSFLLLFLCISMHASEITIETYKSLGDVVRPNVLRALAVRSMQGFNDEGFAKGFDDTYAYAKAKDKDLDAAHFLVKILDNTLTRHSTSKTLVQTLKDQDPWLRTTQALTKLFEFHTPATSDFDSAFSNTHLKRVAKDARERDLGELKTVYKKLVVALLTLYVEAPQLDQQLCTRKNSEDLTYELGHLVSNTKKASSNTNGALINAKIKFLDTAMSTYENTHTLDPVLQRHIDLLDIGARIHLMGTFNTSNPEECPLQ